MRPVSLFMNVSLDGFFEGPDQDLSWSKGDFQAFPQDPDQQADTILLGRRTYDMMAGFWPTAQAEALYPDIARYMNTTQKAVVTHRPVELAWANTTAITHNLTESVRELKQAPGKGIIILGSNNLCVQLMQAGLVDEFQLVLNPVAIGAGTSLFTGLAGRAELALVDSQTSPTGVTMLTYRPA